MVAVAGETTPVAFNQKWVIYNIFPKDFSWNKLQSFVSPNVYFHEIYINFIT